MEPRLTLIVSLTIHAGREAEFEQFEAAAARIMARYGGRIERRIRRVASADPNQPDEVHLVTFPDAPSFERYRSDPELRGLAEFRTRAIRETAIWVGVDLALFDGTD
jgi:uncharacterized protein (DUF1330 family)